MAYIICNNDGQYLYHGKGGDKLVASFDKASTWQKIDAANHVLAQIPKVLKPYNLAVKVSVTENKVNKPPVVKPVALHYDIDEKVKELADFVKNLEERKLFLMSQIQMLDLELVDIQHAAEFYDLSASQGYKLYKLMHEVTTKRREFKDELTKINLSLGTSLNISNLDNLEKSIAGLATQKYTPRIRKELFKA